MTQTQIVRRGGGFVPYVVPSRVPRGSILDHAHIIEDALWLDPEGVIWSYNCIGIDVDPIDDCTDFTGLTKRWDSPNSEDGGSFVVQGGVICKPFGFSGDDPELKSAFQAMEPIGVSRGLNVTLFPAATNITPAAGSVLPVTALAILESYGYLMYAGQPIIHMGPGMISHLAANGAITVQDGKVYTLLGTPIAVSAGYETKTGDLLDPEQWAYVTGAVVLARSEPIQQTAQDTTTNEIVVLFERLYVAAIDCLIAKVKVKVVQPAPAVQSDPQTGPIPGVQTGTDTVEGPGGSWTPPAGDLRSVSIVVTSGSVEVDGDEVTAPNTVNFDADTGEVLDPPMVTASSLNDRCVVAWVTT